MNLGTTEESVKTNGGLGPMNYGDLRSESTNTSLDYSESGHGYDELKNALSYPAGSSYMNVSKKYMSLVYRSGKPIVRKGEKLYFYWAGFPCGYANTGSGSSSVWGLTACYMTYQYCYVWDGSKYILVEPDGDGFLTFPANSYWLIFTARLNAQPSSIGNNTWFYCLPPALYYLEDGTGAISSQTEQLMSTDGSETVTDGPMEYVSQVTGKLGALQQAGETVNGIVDIMANGEPATSIEFPGIVWNGIVVPAQQVPLTGYLGTEVENRIRDGATFVFLIAWIRGLTLLYGRIIEGDKDVIVEESE